jgi:hypothetical protein
VVMVLLPAGNKWSSGTFGNSEVDSR